MPALEFIKAGTLDDTSWLAPTMELWCETAQAWLNPDASRELLTRNPPPGGVTEAYGFCAPFTCVSTA